MKILNLLLVLTFLLSGCNKQMNTASQEQPLSKAEQLVQKAIAAHGGEKYETAHYAFIFRNKAYRFKNNNDRYTYSVTRNKDGEIIKDVLNNQGLKRTVDGEEIQLTDKSNTSYTNALNSVIYFATLPHKLKDAAVNKSYVGETNIKEQSYHIVKVTFDEENGGQDHEDTFHYWINKENNHIDYLAYNYKVNGGGVRFRVAYNPRVVEGIVFQDYVNYKAEVGTPLKDLPALWEQGQLKQLSLIETEEVKRLK